MNPLLGLTRPGSQSGSGQTRSMLAGAKRKQKNQKVWECSRNSGSGGMKENYREFSKVYIQDCDQNRGDYPLSNRGNHTFSCLF
ncbi:hypothetical protein HanRHA438_Chr03g0121291 [Helianthus annuus]|nr:hypothetical protein HanIR_Chr03g0120541 [Helianthus annuus]KAJ0935585.1 hypothetical protein HanRHA438_Chr03g0121291 [Helianthus annuus]